MVSGPRAVLQREVRRAGRIAGFGALTSAMVPAFLAHERLVPEAEQTRVRERWVGAWSSAMLRLFGVTPIVRGPVAGRQSVTGSGAAGPEAGARGCLVVANHRSTADILLLLRMFGGRMVSRSDLATWPLLGFAARAVGTLFVDRSDVLSGARAVRTIRDRLAAGDTVIVFPEGTTFAGDDVRPFRDGAFVASLRCSADVVPVGLAYAKESDAAFLDESFPAHLARMAAAAPSRVAMCVGEPIARGDVVRTAQLRERAQAAVQRLVREARHLVDERA
jgi:1-acyl-sn-glycerol-3-phosphate acyltransferase